jgi:ribose transport system ATP-binding protein
MIFHGVDELARSGVAVLVVSFDLPEALGISDRVLVVCGGRISRSCPGARPPRRR